METKNVLENAILRKWMLWCCVYEGCPKVMPHIFLSPIFIQVLKIQNVDGTLVYILTFYKLSNQFYSFVSAWNDIYARQVPFLNLLMKPISDSTDHIIIWLKLPSVEGIFKGSEEWRGENLKVLCWACRIDAVTSSIQSVWWLPQSMLVWGCVIALKQHTAQDLVKPNTQQMVPHFFQCADICLN